MGSEARVSVRRRWRFGFVAVVAVAVVSALTFAPVGSAAVSTAPKCPTGSKYNSKTKKCEAPAKITCPAGTTLDGTNCVGDATCVTAANGTAGEFFYDYGYGHCRYVTPVPGVCSPPYVDDPGLPGSGYCVALDGARCPEGTTRLVDTNTCSGPAVIDCPDGLDYNTGTKKCESDPATTTTGTCPKPSKYNSKTKKCELPATLGCPIGTSYNGTKCVGPLPCPTAADGTTGKINPNLSGFCYDSLHEFVLCSPPYERDGPGSCGVAVSCPAGTTQVVEDTWWQARCEGPRVKICPDTYTYNSTVDKCQTNPATKPT
jgi:hypothetical protein